MIFVGAAVGSIHLGKLPNPKAPDFKAPEPVTCEITARYSTVASLAFSFLLVLVPWVA